MAQVKMHRQPEWLAATTGNAITSADVFDPLTRSIERHVCFSSATQIVESLRDLLAPDELERALSAARTLSIDGALAERILDVRRRSYGHSRTTGALTRPES